MKIKLNGELRESSAQTVAELLQELQAPVTGVAIAVNEQVIRKSEYATTPLQEGDVVELIRAVQGG
ncbi:MAG: sulfur carrier protein ThiS [Abitibacteriaceae bacterium]|nr:sulfur carrier protein ThiS [Abditibacteriaceae bacterium]